MNRLLYRVGINNSLISVDGTMSVSELIALCKFDSSTSRVNNFVVSNKAKREEKVFLFGGGSDYKKTEEILFEMKERGFRPATIEEILAFALYFPEAQKRVSPIVALGSVGKDTVTGLDCHAVLDHEMDSLISFRTKKKRKLVTNWTKSNDQTWYPGTFFLGVAN